jgi:hypothetical protein
MLWLCASGSKAGTSMRLPVCLNQVALDTILPPLQYFSHSQRIFEFSEVELPRVLDMVAVRNVQRSPSPTSMRTQNSVVLSLKLLKHRKMYVHFQFSRSGTEMYIFETRSLPKSAAYHFWARQRPISAQGILTGSQ